MCVDKQHVHYFRRTLFDTFLSLRQSAETKTEAKLEIRNFGGKHAEKEQSKAKSWKI